MLVMLFCSWCYFCRWCRSPFLSLSLSLPLIYLSRFADITMETSGDDASQTHTTHTYIRTYKHTQTQMLLLLLQLLLLSLALPPSLSLYFFLFLSLSRNISIFHSFSLPPSVFPFYLSFYLNIYVWTFTTLHSCNYHLRIYALIAFTIFLSLLNLSLMSTIAAERYICSAMYCTLTMQYIRIKELQP